jgi:hypothetical protein
MNKFLLLFLIGISVVICGCKKDSESNPSDITNTNTDDNWGILLFDFSWSPKDECSERAILGIAETSQNIVLRKFIETPNVYSNQQYYYFKLRPGIYYVYSAIACTCSETACQAKGYASFNDYLKSCLKQVTVTKGKTVTLKPDFNN